MLYLRREVAEDVREPDLDAFLYRDSGTPPADEDLDWLDSDAGLGCQLNRTPGHDGVELQRLLRSDEAPRLRGLFIDTPAFGVPRTGTRASGDVQAWRIEGAAAEGFVAVPRSALPVVKAAGLPHVVGRLVVLVAVTVTGLAPAPALASARLADEQPAAEETAPEKPTWGELSGGEESPPSDASPAPASSIPDSAWQVLMNKPVVLTTPGGEVQGTLAAVDGSSVTVLGADGTVNVVARTQVTAVRAQPAAAGGADATTPTGAVYSPTYGKGMFAGGIVSTTVGAIAFVAGVGVMAYSLSYYKVFVPLLAVSAVGLGVGIPFTIRGNKRRKLRGKPVPAGVARLSFAPIVSRRRWGGALTLRF